MPAQRSEPTARQDEQPQLGYRDVWFAAIRAARHDEIPMRQLKKLAEQFGATSATPMSAFSINQALERAREEVVRERSTTVVTSPTDVVRSAQQAPPSDGASSTPSPAPLSTDPHQGGLAL